MTNLVLPLLISLAGAAVFDVRTVPISGPDARAFVAPANSDSVADVFLQQGRTLTVFAESVREAGATLTLDEGTTAYDVAVIETKKPPVVIGIRERAFWAYPVPHGTDSQPPLLLFESDTLLSAPVPQPYPAVLVVDFRGQPAIAAACEKALELRRPDGALLASFPTGLDAPQRVTMGTPFRVATVSQPQLAGSGALEKRVWSRFESEPDLPEGLLPIGIRQPLRPRRGPGMLRLAGQQSPVAWPSFPLKKDAQGDARVLYATSPEHPGHTLVRLAGVGKDANAEDASAGPEREYPGTIVVPEDDLPDFNGDGYADLLLWNAPEPAMSIEALTRAVTGRTWPLTLAVHLFSPAKNRYEPSAASQIRCAVPVLWLLAPKAQGPVDHCLLRDINGDGRADFACATDADTWCVWLYGENGFSASPDFSLRVDAPIRNIDFKTDLAGNHRTSLALRTEQHIYILRAR